MQRSLGIILLTVVFATGPSPRTLAGEASSFEEIVKNYEEIRQVLLHDSFDNVAGPAGRIRHLIHGLDGVSSDEAAGIRAGGGDDLRALLSSAEEAVADLIKAATIEDAREAFGRLSKPMVQYRQLVPAPAPVVAYCSMAQQVWLQPKGEIGNPYYGQSMARCGEIVSE